MPKAQPAAKAMTPEQSHLWIGVVLFLVGIAYLMSDLGIADVTAGIQWYTVLFLLFGLKMMFKGYVKN